MCGFCRSYSTKIVLLFKNLKKTASSFSEAERFVILTKNEQENIEENGVRIEVMPVYRFLREMKQ